MLDLHHQTLLLEWRSLVKIGSGQKGKKRRKKSEWEKKEELFFGGMETPGIDPGTSRMQSERSSI